MMKKFEDNTWQTCPERMVFVIIEQITMRALMEKRTEVLQTLVSMIEATRREKGCMSYWVYKDIEDESLFIVNAEWRTHKDLEDHIKSDRFAVLLGTKSFLHEPPKIWIHTVSNSEGIETVHNIRSKNT